MGGEESIRREWKGKERKGLNLFEDLMQIIWQKLYLEIEMWCYTAI